MKLYLLLASLVVVSLTRVEAQQPAARPAGPASPALSWSGLQLDALDTRADACTDFYQFACGGWIAKNPVPADRSGYGRFDELTERNNDVLRRILDAAVAGGAADSKKIGDYYASCMDESGIDARGAAALDPILKKIAALAGVADLAPLVAELHTIGVNVFFQFGSQADFKDASVEMVIADQGGLGLPDRNYYLKDDAKSVELRTQYVEHVGRMAALLGAAPDQAKASSQQVMAIETALARGALDNVSRRDPNKVYHQMSNAELQALTPRFLWTRYVSGIGSPPIDALNVAEPEFIKAFGQIVAATPLDTVKMVHELEGALEADINGLAWMTPATRREALIKLHAVADKIGYPDHWRDYTALTIVRGDALGNSQRANTFEFHRQMSKIGKPVDKSQWSMTPPDPHSPGHDRVNGVVANMPEFQKAFRCKAGTPMVRANTCRVW